MDHIIICQKPRDNEELLKVVARQAHRHSHTCHKNTKRECTFNYPQTPMRQTEILYPLDTDVAKTETKKTRGHMEIN